MQPNDEARNFNALFAKSVLLNPNIENEGFIKKTSTENK